MARLKLSGVILGRKKGEIPQNTKLNKLRPQIIEMLDAGWTKSKISKELGICREYMGKYLKKIGY
jgi:hypothetical protein